MPHQRVESATFTQDERNLINISGMQAMYPSNSNFTHQPPNMIQNVPSQVVPSNGYQHHLSPHLKMPSSATTIPYHHHHHHYPHLIPGGGGGGGGDHQLPNNYPGTFGVGPYQLQYQSPPIFPSHWQSGGYGYAMPPSGSPSIHPANSPALSSSNSFSPASSGVTTTRRLPDSPSLLDTGSILLSPGRFRKRRQLSPLIPTDYIDSPPTSAPGTPQSQQLASNMLLRRAPLPKIPVSPNATSIGSSPRSKSSNLILPCFFDQQNNLRTHGPQSLAHVSPSGYWDDTRRNVRAFLDEADAIDEENITIIEIKQMLRRYCINATGKKTLLMDRIRQLKAYLRAQLERETASLPTQMAAPNSSEAHGSAPDCASIWARDEEMARQALESLDSAKENALPPNA